ncbi:MAG TPA: MgtC/SapB family protein [Thermomicrobiales bacterium]|nr:MgtC/SapB family protein [Thermomicrobiales bacterium]
MDVDIDWGTADLTAMHGLSYIDLLLRLGVATLLGALVGLERERLERAAGFRTHALVCVASALIMVVSIFGFPQSDVLDPSRIAAQVVSGIGFLGAGVIIFRRNTVRGLTTAASLWSVAGVGLAVGAGLYIPATAGTVFMLLIQAGMRPIEAHFFKHESRRQRLLIETTDASGLLKGVPIIGARHGMRVQSMQFERDSSTDTDVVELTIRLENLNERFGIVSDLQEVPGVVRVHDGFGPAVLRRTGRRGIGFQEDDEDEVNGGIV